MIDAACHAIGVFLVSSLLTLNFFFFFFASCSSVSIANFERVIVGWVRSAEVTLKNTLNV